MQLFTVDRNYLKLDVIEEFSSLIWTERYYGDGECQVVVPLKRSLINKLQAGTFLAIDQSPELMIIETFSIEEGHIKVDAISISSWLNNRFVRNSVKHQKTAWKIKNQKPGELLWTIVKQMCCKSSTIIGSNNMGLGSAARERELIIPGLMLDDYSKAGKNIETTLVPFGPVYDAVRKIAEQYHVGMKIWLKESDRSLRFRSYVGANRTSDIKKNPSGKIVRFSPIMDSLANINEIRSRGDYKTLVYSYASSLQMVDTRDDNDNPDSWLQQDNKPGISRRSSSVGKYTGFDLRAELLFADDIQLKYDFNEDSDSPPEVTFSDRRAQLVRILNGRAEKEMKQHEYIRTVDGEIAPTNLYQYGIDYDLGDLIEVQGNTELTEISRVTEYIRTQNAEGETAYPTVVAVDP